MAQLAEKYKDKNVVWLAVQQHRTRISRKEQGIRRPVQNPLSHPRDFDGTVGHLYDAKTTPHMFIIDAKGSLVYNGAIDNARSANQKTA